MEIKVFKNIPQKIFPKHSRGGEKGIKEVNTLTEKNKVFGAYKAAFTAAFALLLLGAIMIQIGYYISSDAGIDRSYGGLDQEGYKNAMDNSLIAITIGNLIIIVGGIVLAIKTFYLALDPHVIESENVRAGLLVFVGLILAFVAIQGGSMYIYYFF